jgi:fumarate reductase subunit C
MTQHTSQPYRPTLPGDWWLQHPGYLRYMLRELTCVAIGAYAGLLIVGLLRLGQGPEAWDAFRLAIGSGPGVALQLIAWLFAIYHSVSWFALAPRTMPLQIGARRVPGGWIAGAHYLAWAVISLVLLLAVGV